MYTRRVITDSAASTRAAVRARVNKRRRRRCRCRLLFVYLPHTAPNAFYLSNYDKRKFADNRNRVYALYIIIVSSIAPAIRAIQTALRL
jgi:hypothetical protein